LKYFSGNLKKFGKEAEFSQKAIPSGERAMPMARG
jgi:hypothetical protein